MSMAIPGSELTKEPFRWDQRLFSLVLRIPGVSPIDNDRCGSMVSMDGSPINAMCEVTGGRSSAHVQYILYHSQSNAMGNGTLQIALKHK